MARGYGLNGRRCVPGRGKRFVLFHNAETGSRALSITYTIGTTGSFSRE
jgi:hypothetical protein